MERENEILSFQNELLSQHVYLMMGHYEDLFGDRWARISSLRCGVEPSVMERATRAAIVFHDFGKVAYQSRIMRGWGSPLHEYFSVAYLKHLWDHLIRWLGSEEMCLAVAWSIILHHLSMREPISSSDFLRSKLRSYNMRPVHDLSEAETKCLAAIIGQYLDNDLSKAAKGISKLDALVSVEVVQEAKRCLRHMYKLALRITKVLIVTDNLAASSRGYSRKKVFLEDIPSKESVSYARKVILNWLGL